jgi:hypothetical protein
MLLLSGVFLSSASEHYKTLAQLTAFTKFPGVALSTGFLENRVLEYQDNSSRIYPQMRYYKRMDYVYAP